MKTLFFAFFVCLLLSCSSYNDCLPMDYLGVWEGTLDCESSNPELALFDISQGSGSDVLILNSGNNPYMAIVEDCKIIIPIQTLSTVGIEIEISGEGRLEENGTLIIQQTQKLLGIEETCTISMTQ